MFDGYVLLSFLSLTMFRLGIPFESTAPLAQFSNGRQGGQTLEQVLFNGKARDTFRPKN